jgi:hypothetical protein
MSRWGNGTSGRLVGVEESSKSAYLFSIKFPSAWIHPVGCPTGGCAGLLKDNVSWTTQKQSIIMYRDVDIYNRNGRRDNDREDIGSLKTRHHLSLWV